MADTPKKILFFISASYVGGLEIIGLQLMQALKEKGYNIHCIINGWNDKDFKGRLTSVGIPYTEAKLGWIYVRKPSWTIDSLLHYPVAYIKCRKAIRQFNPDVLHFFNFQNFIMLYPAIPSGRVVYSLHETNPPGGKMAWIYNTLNKKTAYFTAVSRHIVKVLENMPVDKNKIKLVYNGIPYKNAEPVKIPAGTGLRFAIVGFVSEVKGHWIIVKASAILKSRGISNFTIAIIGNDKTQYASVLREQIKDEGVSEFFTWPGFISDQHAIYSNCDVVLLPSTVEESFSLSTGEAMAYGKGLIVTDNGALPELILHEETGLVCEMGNPTAFADAMEHAIKHPEDVERWGEQAQMRVRNLFSIEQMVKGYTDIYDAI